jgi:uncharacterized damage-inducible protein DinB
MTTIERMSRQLHHTYRGPSWHGLTLVELLSDVKAEEAARLVLPNVHSIWEIVLHAAAWKRAVRLRIDGGPAQLEGDADWPKVVDTSYRAWGDALADLDAAHAVLESRVRQMAESDFDRLAPAGDATLFQTLHGVMEHDVYHAGQIAILKKVIRSR